jgi:hypothetical protein
MNCARCADNLAAKAKKYVKAKSHFVRVAVIQSIPAALVS